MNILSLMIILVDNDDYHDACDDDDGDDNDYGSIEPNDDKYHDSEDDKHIYTPDRPRLQFSKLLKNQF